MSTRLTTLVPPSCKWRWKSSVWALDGAHALATRAHCARLAHASYTIKELQKDINKQLEAITDVQERERLRESTKLGIFVVHNK